MDLRSILIPLAGLPILLLTWILALRAWRGIRQARNVSTWRPVPGSIIASEVRETTVTVQSNIGIMQKRIALRYFPHVVYEYHLAGRRYENDRINLAAAVLTSEPEPAAKASARYPVGSPVSVYANPADPTEAVLDPRVGWDVIIYGLVALVLLLIAVLIMVVFASLPPQSF